MALITPTEILSTMNVLSQGAALNGGLIMLTNPAYMVPPTDETQKTMLRNVISYFQKVIGDVKPETTTASTNTSDDEDVVVAAAPVAETKVTSETIFAVPAIPVRRAPRKDIANCVEEEPEEEPEQTHEIAEIDFSFLEGCVDQIAMPPPAVPVSDVVLQTPAHQPTYEVATTATTTADVDILEQAMNCADMYDLPPPSVMADDSITCVDCQGKFDRVECSYTNFEIIPCGHFMCDTCFHAHRGFECLYCHGHINKKDMIDELLDVCCDAEAFALLDMAEKEEKEEKEAEEAEAEAAELDDEKDMVDVTPVVVVNNNNKRKIDTTEQEAAPAKKARTSSGGVGMRGTKKPRNVPNRNWIQYAKDNADPSKPARKINFAKTEVADMQAVRQAYKLPRDDKCYLKNVKKSKCVLGDIDVCRVLKDIYMAKMDAKSAVKPSLPTKFLTRFVSNLQVGKCRVCAMDLHEESARDCGCNCIGTECLRCHKIDVALRRVALPSENPEKHCLKCLSHRGDFDMPAC
ncbi:hypothetical protein AbHV_ORF57 [Abalone herpesvirus Victoria/AUS/2009]|uniref:RING-type domain-containing protein n=1 Tax=Abalone herpesvirus (isolate Abalone/Australia/Victoria/2009) TaxID=1241371 RepID=K4JUI4_ABHV|nr:hypothetical protein AbHV_ORF57 [Abalone herpesvirus Victoria/AUS/2009]AFU90069.1 hypothetical protein AbHV_ORF57 [Abalone herpesvirus Victoria/AUS/2009]